MRLLETHYYPYDNKEAVIDILWLDQLYSLSVTSKLELRNNASLQLSSTGVEPYTHIDLRELYEENPITEEYSSYLCTPIELTNLFTNRYTILINS